MISVVVVEPQNKGNVGTIARAMKNFGFGDLKLVDPPAFEPGDEAYGFAGHAREDVLPDYDAVTFEAVVANFHTVGFTAITGESDHKHVRYPFATPAELADSLADLDADTALVFGRERIGLTNTELAQLDEVCSIPAAPEYPVLNLGQAATVALYELRDLALDRSQHATRTRAEAHEIEGLYEQLDALLGATDHVEEKRPKTNRLFRRVFGRARLTGREVATLRGVFRRATDAIENPD